MRKIVAAWIEQELEFDSRMEYLAYISELEQTERKFKEVSYHQDDTGKVHLRVMKQYNNNSFPE